MIRHQSTRTIVLITILNENIALFGEGVCWPLGPLRALSKALLEGPGRGTAQAISELGVGERGCGNPAGGQRPSRGWRSRPRLSDFLKKSRIRDSNFLMDDFLLHRRGVQIVDIMAYL